MIRAIIWASWYWNFCYQIPLNNMVKYLCSWETKFSPAWPGSPGTPQPLEAAATKEISPNRLWHLVGGLHRGLHGGSHVPANYAKPETAFEQIEISPAFEAAVANYGRQQSGMLFIKAVWHNSVLNIHDYF